MKTEIKLIGIITIFVMVSYLASVLQIFQNYDEMIGTLGLFSILFYFYSIKKFKGITVNTYNNPSPKMTNEQLYVLRGLAAIMVFLGHSNVVFSRNLRENSWIINFLTFFPPWLGMAIFFALSGYLISSSFITSKYSFNSAGFLKFIIHRIFRLLPLLVFLLIFIDIAQIDDIDLSTFFRITSFTYFETSVRATSAWWSLSVEMFFYFAAPFILCLFFRIKKRVWMLVALVFFLLFILRTTFWFSGISMPQSWHLTYLTFLGNLDFFIVGIMAARNIEQQKKVIAEKYLRNGFLILILYFFLYSLISFEGLSSNNYFFATVFMIFLPTISCFILFHAIIRIIHFPSRVFLLNRFLIYFGKNSYSFYLIHIIVLNEVLNLSLSIGFFLQTLISFFITLILATILSATVEKVGISFGRQIASRLGN